ncbi:caspase family protein [Crossiella sp. CA-258035]|uniref:caspase family protein n=1 Tax=Crossiella sp. CA-258035 TaxID=2981138 RepID=UPI0024BBF24E|nr:caspase family protein [Crossiella sp. CA-258035]WHT21807.1 caspase family protein [Crossiella sp. CA-258035]
MHRPPERRLSRAVLIGTSDYLHAEELPPLPAVGNNLADLRRALTDPDTGILDRGQCTVIDTPDSPASLLDRLAAVAGQAEDLLLVYYAGHGIRHPVKERLFLGVRQTSQRSLWGTGVPFDSVREIIEGSPARTRLLLLDCCYSGLAVSTMSPAGVDIQEVDVRGTAVIASSPRNERSHSPVGEAHTAFTGEVIRLLQDGSPLRDAPLTVQQLFRSVSAALARRELPRPKGSLGDTSGDLLLRRESGRPGAEVAEPAGRVAAEPVRPDAEVVKPEVRVAAEPMRSGAEVVEPPVRVAPELIWPGLPVVAAEREPVAGTKPVQPVPYVPPGPPSVEYLRGRPMPASYYRRVFGSALTTALLWLLFAYLSGQGAGVLLQAGLAGSLSPLGLAMLVVGLMFGLVLRFRYRVRLLRGPRWPPLPQVRPRLALGLYRAANVLVWAALPALAVAAYAVVVNTGELNYGFHFLAVEAIVGDLYLMRRLNELSW